MKFGRLIRPPKADRNDGGSAYPFDYVDIRFSHVIIC